MISVLRRKRSRLLVAALPLLSIGWLVMEARQWLFRAQVEALLADIMSLELNRSSWSDAQRLMTRWGKWGEWYGNCSVEECIYSIKYYHLQLVYQPLVLEEGPHISA